MAQNEKFEFERGAKVKVFIPDLMTFANGTVVREFNHNTTIVNFGNLYFTLLPGTKWYDNEWGFHNKLITLREE